MLTTSTNSVLLQTLSNIHNGMSQYADLSNQTATGVKSSNLADYTGAEARKLIDEQTQTTRYNSYNSAIDLVDTRLKNYNTIMSAMDDLVSNVKIAVTAQRSYTTLDKASVQVQINNALAQVASLLNEQVGGRYLFGGGNYGTAPVNDDLGQHDSGQLATSNVNPYAKTTKASITNADVNSTIVNSTDSTLPSYLQSTATNAVWTEDSFSPEQRKTVTYGISAADNTFQKIIYGLQVAKAAFAQGADQNSSSGANAAQTTYQNYRGVALAQLSDGLDGLKMLQSKVSINLKSVDASKTLNKTFISILADQRDSISGVDTAELGTKLTALQTQLQATYSVTSRLQKLSLVNYL